MRIFRSFEEAKNIVNPVVTTGSFDGVHIGHKTILNRLRMLADKYYGESVLITFDPHPRKVLYPDTAGKDLKLINSQEEKLDLLEKAGLDNVIIVEFTREFSKITSEQFVRDLLHGILHAKVVVVGFNHHFGFNKEGDYKQLWEWQEKYHFEAEEIPEQEVQHETVSSWLGAWKTDGLIGIYDCPRSGRPVRFTVDEQAAFLGYIDENPHQPKAAAARLLVETGKEASLDTFKRILKKVPTLGNVADNP